MIKGSSKTLREAIDNGFTDYYMTSNDPNRMIEKHIKEFMGQHFQYLILKNPEAQDVLNQLWARLTVEEK
jgi:hypothetical protein